MAEAGRDEAYLLDMLLAARDARAFVSGRDEAAFRASRLHQNAVIRSLEMKPTRPPGAVYVLRLAP